MAAQVGRNVAERVPMALFVDEQVNVVKQAHDGQRRWRLEIRKDNRVRSHRRAELDHCQRNYTNTPGEIERVLRRHKPHSAVRVVR